MDGPSIRAVILPPLMVLEKRRVAKKRLNFLFFQKLL